MRLQNKVIVVTGAGGGIGRSIAARLASEGAHLALFDIGDSVDETVAAIAEVAAGAGAPEQVALTP